MVKPMVELLVFGTMKRCDTAAIVPYAYRILIDPSTLIKLCVRKAMRLSLTVRSCTLRCFYSIDQKRKMWPVV